MINHPKISVIIPAYNAERTIRGCVNAMLRQNYAGEFEVIAVDDGSTDTTAGILKGFDRIQYVWQANAGPAAARNTGAKQATGEIICFTDADCQPQADWLTKIAEYVADGPLDVLAGSYGIANKESLLARCVHQEIMFRHQTLMGDWIEVFGSYNVAFRREIFERFNGFDQRYRIASAEDNDLSYRLRVAGIKIRFAKDLLVDHAHPTSVLRYLKEQCRHGYWRARLYRSHPKQMRGDGYTFFKDMIEVPISLVLAGCAAADLLGLINVPTAAIFLALVIVESVFARLFGLRNFVEIVFYGLVMALRALARTAGFVRGLKR